jgi:hypothetical protein
LQGRLRSLADRAVLAIERLLDDEHVPAAVRLKVAEIALNAAGGIPHQAEPIGPCDPHAALRYQQRLQLLDEI